MLSIVGCLLVASAASPAASQARAPIRPVLGNWEGSGPFGLRLSFALVRSGRSVVVKRFALGLPTGCRATGAGAWDTAYQPGISYVAPGTRLNGPFPPLGRKQFEFIIAPTVKNPTVVQMDGTFSSTRRGVVSINSPTVNCGHTRWPRTLRFRLAAAHRVPVPDGLWTGTVSGPPAGITGNVSVRVIDGGRIETDFKASFTCPAKAHQAPAAGAFEIGPLPTTGAFIAPGGVVGGVAGPQTITVGSQTATATTSWTGHFIAGGMLSGTFTSVAPDPSTCGAPVLHPTFTARRTAA